MSTKDTGVDFIHRIMAEVKVLQDNVAHLTRSTAQLQTELRAEASGREGDVAAVHQRIARECATEVQERSALEKRLEEFEGSTRMDLDLLKAQLGQLGISATELQSLTDRVTEHHKSHERDRAATSAALRTSSEKGAADLHAAYAAMEQLRQATEAGRKALASELAAVYAKVHSVDAFSQTHARAADLQAMAQRIDENDRSLDRLASEVKMRAMASTVTSVSERLTSVSMDIQAMQAKGESDRDHLRSSLDKVEKSLAKTDRQVDSERERNSSCLVALEKEVASKSSKADLGSFSKRLEQLEKNLHSHVPSIYQVAPLRNRIAALEEALPAHGDATDLAKLHLALAEQAAKHDALHAHSNKTSAKLEKAHRDLLRTLSRVEAVEMRNVALERTVRSKAEATDHFTKDNTEDLLGNFYRREEIDAMLSRVWWRVGDISKGRTASGIPLSIR